MADPVFPQDRPPLSILLNNLNIQQCAEFLPTMPKKAYSKGYFTIDDFLPYTKG